MKNVIIMGAAGRDFHNFNTYFRDNPNFKVVAFTATQIPDIAGRKYPAVLAGKMYPDGIPIFPEEELTDLIRKNNVTKVYFSYSDTSHEYVMHRASQVQAAGASFILLGPVDTMVKSVKPVISICAVRTGCGKSQTTRKVGAVLIAIGYRLFRSEGSVVATDTTSMLPKGARIVSTGIAGDRLVVTLDVGGVTEIRTFDAKTLKPVGKLK